MIPSIRYLSVIVAIAGNPVCVHQTTYVDTVFLPFWQNGYNMVYQRCCRNGSVHEYFNSIAHRDDTGRRNVPELHNSCCKSSPQIGAYPPIYICVNKDIDYFLPNATDLQGDSFVQSGNAFFGRRYHQQYAATSQCAAL